ncbi:MAG: hypothetical protein P8X77_07665 [Maritimibacter sp.]|jgi:hypothetical protein
MIHPDRNDAGRKLYTSLAHKPGGQNGFAVENRTQCDCFHKFSESSVFPRARSTQLIATKEKGREFPAFFSDF